MLSIKQIKSVTFNSTRNAASDPFYLVLQIGSLLILAGLANLPSLSESEHMRFVRDQCLSFTFIAGCLGTLFATIKTVTDDIQRGAGDIMMSRPISPTVLLLGKLSGLIFSQSLFFISLAAAYLWISEIAYDNHTNYTSLIFYVLAIIIGPVIAALRQAFFNKAFPFFATLSIPICMLIGVILNLLLTEHRYFDFLGLQAVLLIFMAVISFAGILMPFAVKFDTPLVLSFGAIIFFLGLFTNYMIANFLGNNSLATLLLSTLPNWQIYWILDQIALKGPVSATYVLSCLAQSFLLCSLYLCAAITFFEKREISGNIS